MTGSSISRGARALLGAQVSRAAVNIVGLVVLSRLLTPDEVGVVAVVAAVVNIATVAGDLGLSVAAIREKHLDRPQWSALFWVNTAVGLVLTVALAALSNGVAHVTGRDAAVPFLLVAAPVFLVNGVAAQYRVELVRSARYQRLAVSEAAAPALGLVLAVVLAAAGAGSWALMVQMIAPPVVLLMLVTSAVRLAPGAPRVPRGIGRLVRLGAVLSVQQVLDMASGQIAPLALAPHASASAIGAYSRAAQLIKQPHQQLAGSLTRVVVPALSRVYGDGSAEFGRRLAVARATYGYGVGVATALIGGLSAPLVSVVLGAQWEVGTPGIVRLLSIGWLLRALSYVFLWGMTAAGATRRLLVAEVPTNVLIITGVLLSASRGVYAVAAVYVGGALVRLVLRTAVGMRELGIDRRSHFASSFANLVVLGLVLGGGLVVADVMRERNSVVTLAVGIAWSAAVIGGSSVMSVTVRRDLQVAWRQIWRVTGIGGLVMVFSTVSSRVARLLPARARYALGYLRRNGTLRHVWAPRRYTELVRRRVHLERDASRVWACGKLEQRARIAQMNVPVRMVPQLWHGAQPQAIRDSDVDGDWVFKPNNGRGSNCVVFGNGTPTSAVLDDLAEQAKALTRDEKGIAPWGYTRVRREYMVERRVGDPGTVLVDYRCHVFHGRAEVITVSGGWAGAEGGDDRWHSYFDRDWRLFDVSRSDKGRPRAVDRPERLAEMVSAAEAIAAGFDYLRVDFYIHDGEIYFGETGYYPGGGAAQFSDPAFDHYLGDLWRGVRPQPFRYAA